MIIQILADLKEEGYLARGRHPVIAPFFAGANVAFRRTALDAVGDYDQKCLTGEDCDMCARLTEAGWELYMRSDAVVFHRNPSILTRLIRQWYGYGRYHPYLFAKHNESALELYVRLGRPVAGERYSCLLYKRLPIAIIIFFTKFLMLHLFFCGMIVAWLLGWAAAGWVSLSFTAALAFLYAWPDLRDAGLYSGWSFAAVRYVADMALFIGAFIGGLRQKMLYFSATVD